MKVHGTVRADRKTKDLVGRLQPGDIALIDHTDLDQVSAHGLLKAKVKAVINAADSSTGRYPNYGPLMLVNEGIVLLDEVGAHVHDVVADGDNLTIDGEDIFCNDRWIGRGSLQTAPHLQQKLAEGEASLDLALQQFVDNTLEHALREKSFYAEVAMPPVCTAFEDEVVLVVVRGAGHEDDLRALAVFIREQRPVLVGVDGGADALVAAGHVPHMIIGDMDSVSDATLRCGAELLVHAYRDGRAPGMERLKRLGLHAIAVRAAGTSEDVALLIAHSSGARFIVAVGTHTHVIDFLEKGRPGMASTLLVRMKVGPILFDAKGVSRLYAVRAPRNQMVPLLAAAFVPVVALVMVSQPLQMWLSLIWLRVRVLVGW